MTLPASGQIAFSDVNTEIGRSATYSSDLSFLNSQIKPSVRPSTPYQLNQFYGLAYFQNNAEGNCTNNGANCSGNCTAATTGGRAEGNENCQVCVNCATVNCANCDTQSYLQTNCNCACTYNCNSNQNCFTTDCNCSKIICTHLYEIGLMPQKIFEADQAFGEYLKKENPSIYRGYIRWAEIIVDGMRGVGPDFMFWIKESQRKEHQKAAVIRWSNRVAKPWSEHMAYVMNATKRDNLLGRIIMKLGRPICQFVDFLPVSNTPTTLIQVYSIWAAFISIYFIAKAYVSINNFFNRLRGRVIQEV